MGSCNDWRNWSHLNGDRKKDPMSHRIIEKRRRDRMNNCLADLSRLIPAEYLKKGRGRIEKTEIIEMAIKHMKYLQAQICNIEPCEEKSDTIHRGNMIADKPYLNGTRVHQDSELSPQVHYKFGYRDCLTETMHFLVELEGFYPTDALCVKLIDHLQKYYEKVAKGDQLPCQNPSESVGSPSEVDTKINGYNGSSINAIIDYSVSNSVISSVHSDDSCQESGIISSQLREMLVGPHLNTLYVPTVRPNVIRHSSPDPPSPNPELNTDTQSSNGSMYKFKNYIKERFSAEHSSNDSTSSTDIGKSFSPSVVDCGKKRRSDYADRSMHSPSSQDMKPSMEDHFQSKPIPIFALHSKGSYYIPLTVDSHLLTPFFSELNSDYGVSAFSSLVLHPVTISVNFNRSVSQPKAIEYKPLLSPNLSIPLPRIQSSPLLMVSECR